MGLAEVGTPLSHEETMKWAPYVRKHGIIQFINMYNKQRTRRNDDFKWGDEIEYTIVKFDQKNDEVKLNLKGEDILKELNNTKDGFWAPEYGAFMIEGTPAKPFEGLDFSSVEENMRKRRREVKNLLKSDEDLMSITSFPRMGCKNFTYPNAKPTPEDGLTKSIFFPDACIFPGHPRYKNTTTNIMRRRGEKPFYNLPVFKDIHTKNPVDDCYKHEKNALSDHVYLDSMGFGCGYSCLQVTFQASDLKEARTLYDQMAPFCPIMMALTAAAPFHRGFITDVDTRWNILCNTQDCRTKEEKGFLPLKKNKFVINKSRHDSIDCYISPEGQKFNDLEIPYHNEDYQKLIDNGVDALLAQHIAHLFIRDTISVFQEKIYQNDEESIDHFENIQSTVWQTMRLKPPPLNTSIGWRVEFRPCDVQITDFENAAVVSFLVLLTRVILSFNLNFLIPISKVDENIQRAQKRNAVQEQKFWFSKDIFQNNRVKNDDNISNGRRTSGLKDVRITKNFFTNIQKKIKLDNEIYKENGNTTKKNMYTFEKRRNSLQLKNEYVEKYKSKNEIKKNRSLKKLSLQEEKINFDDLFNGENNVLAYAYLKKLLLNNELSKEIVENGNLEEEEENMENGFVDKRKIKNGFVNGNSDNCIELTINEIINGKKDDFPGIIPLMKKYLDTLNLDVTNHRHIQRYLQLIEDRASGKTLTPASWMRKFAMEHPDYKGDSVVNEKMNFDLLKTMRAFQNEETHCTELLGQHNINCK